MTLGHVLIIGTPWIFRQGVKQILKRLGLAIVGEGDTFADAWTSKPNAVRPTIILVILGEGTQVEAALAEARAAKEAFHNAKLAFLSETALAADVPAAIRAGADALLSSKLSSRMLGHSLQLVLLGQKLFPALPFYEPGSEGVGAKPVGTMGARSVATEPLAADAPAPMPPFSLSPLQKPPEPPCLAVPLADAVAHVIRLEDHVPPARPHSPAASLVWNNTRPALAGTLRPAAPSDREWEILRCLSSGSSNKAIARELSIAETTVKVHIKSLLRKLAVSNRTQAAIWALNHGGSAGPEAAPLHAPAHLHGK